MSEASAKFIIGAKQVKNTILTDKALKVYVASDCDEYVSKPVIELAKAHNVELVFVDTRKELGEMCGIDVKASCAVKTI